MKNLREKRITTKMNLKIIGQGMTYKDPSVDQLCHLLLSSRKILCYKWEIKLLISVLIIIMPIM
jgi:hypothetical protein